jgi:hypothetical protein
MARSKDVPVAYGPDTSGVELFERAAETQRYTSNDEAFSKKSVVPTPYPPDGHLVEQERGKAKA